MSALTAAKSIGERVAIETGYPSIAQFAINRLIPGQQLNISKEATVERGVRLRGHITLEPDSKVDSDSQLSGTITLGKGGRIGPNSRIDGRVSIGQGTNLNEETEVLGAKDETVSIGKYNAIARRTTFQNTYHIMNKPGVQAKFYREKIGDSLGEISKGPLRVGSDVWIGVDTIVLSGVDIGHGAVIGAGAVVTKDVSPYSIVAGTPAKRIGWRFDEQTRKQLLDVEWWEWDEETIRRNSAFFRTNIETISDISKLIN